MTHQDLIHFIEEEEKTVYSFCHMLTGNKVDAEELYQEAMLLAIEHYSEIYRSEAFRYNQEDGTITRNEEYEGINLLFDLPIDPAYGDEQKVRNI